MIESLDHFPYMVATDFSSPSGGHRIFTARMPKVQDDDGIFSSGSFDLRSICRLLPKNPIISGEFRYLGSIYADGGLAYALDESVRNPM